MAKITIDFPASVDLTQTIHEEFLALGVKHLDTYKAIDWDMECTPKQLKRVFAIIEREGLRAHFLTPLGYDKSQHVLELFKGTALEPKMSLSRLGGPAIQGHVETYEEYSQAMSIISDVRNNYYVDRVHKVVKIS
jgi:hypothetical protein